MKSSILSLALLLAASFSSVAGVDLGAPASRTPYDRYMGSVKQVMHSLSGGGSDMDKVKTLLKQGRGFRYSFTEPYVAATPEVTAAKKAGDCKAKALWLCDQLGDANVRYVVGKTHRGSKLSHAWVLWKGDGKWWILDPTNTSVPIAADRVSSNDYIPLFSWSKGSAYHHAETQNFLAGVAGKRNRAPVAGQSNR
jgi:hypothetical protein